MKCQRSGDVSQYLWKCYMESAVTMGKKDEYNKIFKELLRYNSLIIFLKLRITFLNINTVDSLLFG